MHEHNISNQKIQKGQEVSSVTMGANQRCDDVEYGLRKNFPADLSRWQM